MGTMSIDQTIRVYEMESYVGHRMGQSTTKAKYRISFLDVQIEVLCVRWTNICEKCISIENNKWAKHSCHLWRWFKPRESGWSSKNFKSRMETTSQILEKFNSHHFWTDKITIEWTYHFLSYGWMFYDLSTKILWFFVRIFP